MIKKTIYIKAKIKKINKKIPKINMGELDFEENKIDNYEKDLDDLSNTIIKLIIFTASIPLVLNIIFCIVLLVILYKR